MDRMEETSLSPTSSDSLRPAADRRYESSPAASRPPRLTPPSRTLRTYSKRSRSAEDEYVAPKSTKKQKMTAKGSPIARPTELPRPPPPPQPPAPQTSNIPKSSILSYFKPCRSSSAKEDPDLLSDAEKLVSTPPSSPPIVRRMREPRRLRLRPSVTTIPPTPPPSSSDAVQESEDENARTLRLRRRRRQPGEEDRLEKGRARTSRRGGQQIQEAEDDRVKERTPSSAGDKENELARRKSTTAKARAAAMVQTTINISSKPTFMECKTCRIVYNPLHPPDVKYHSQKHAAFLRLRNRGRA